MSTDIIFFKQHADTANIKVWDKLHVVGLDGIV